MAEPVVCAFVMSKIVGDQTTRKAERRKLPCGEAGKRFLVNGTFRIALCHKHETSFRRGLQTGSTFEVIES